MAYKAIIIGATGLVGSEILTYLLQDERVENIAVFVRRSTGRVDPKLTEHIVNFEDLTSWKHLITGDVLFSALGTTLSQVGSRSAQRIVDYDYQLRVIQSAKINGVTNLVLVSAPGAHPKSSFAYTRMKGDLERDVMKLSFPKLTIIRPGLLKGVREQKRFFEHTAGQILNFFPTVPGLEAMKPVSGKLVAHVCIETAFDQYTGLRTLNPKNVLAYLKA